MTEIVGYVIRAGLNQVTKEPDIEIVVLVGIPDVKDIFDRYKLRWMGELSKSYILEVVHEFYDSSTAFIDLITPVRKRA